MFEKNLRIPCLIDTYGQLLSDRKRELLDYYYNEDYSLSEISELTGISRQGVRKSVKKSEAELLEYEEKLHLYEIKTKLGASLSEAVDAIEQLEASSDGEISSALGVLKSKLAAAAGIL